VTFSAVSAPDPGTVSVSAVVVAPAVGQPATAQVDVTANTPAGSYTVTVTATNEDSAPQSAECSLSVTVNDLPDPTPVPPPPDPELDTAALWSLVQAAVADGGVASSKARLLTDRLERIDGFMASGKDSAAAAQLQALANQAMGLSPRWLSPEAASALADEADSLRAALTS
jgi:hypothetical protein